MDKIKLFKEKIANLLAEKETLVNLALTETREMTDIESTRGAEIDEEVRSLEEMLNVLKVRCKAPEEPIAEPIIENTVYTDEELTEAVREFIADTRTESEKRADANPTVPSDATKINKTKDHAAILPRNISDFMLKHLEEHSEVFSTVTKYPASNGEFEIVMDTCALEDNAGKYIYRVEEGKALGDFSMMDFDVVKLFEDRYAASYSITQHLINNSKFDLVRHCIEHLAERFANGIEYEIFNGVAERNVANKGFRGLCDVDQSHTKALDVFYSKKEEAGTHTAGVLDQFSPDHILRMITSMHPSFLGNAKFYMNRRNFQRVASMKEEGLGPFSSEYLTQNGVKNGKVTYTLFGYPIVVTQGMPNDKLIFGEIDKAYGMTINKNIELKHIFDDTIQATQGTHLLTADMYMDGAVINPQAYVIGVVKELPATAPTP
ncbi:MAG: phage major capsid protein [Clostridium sp.]|uniref:phage major capsid protein n=1 Tax=Clostridium sp. TaxID=1506 RepID=UPI003F2C8DB2